MLITRAKPLELTSHLTLEQAAARKRVSYEALRRWLAEHPEIELFYLGKYLLVRNDALQNYHPYKQ